MLRINYFCESKQWLYACLYVEFMQNENGCERMQTTIKHLCKYQKNLTSGILTSGFFLTSWNLANIKKKP